MDKNSVDQAAVMEVLGTLEYLSPLKESINHLKDEREKLTSKPFPSYEKCLAKLAPDTISLEQYEIAKELIQALLQPGAAEECLKLIDYYNNKVEDDIKRYVRQCETQIAV